MFAKEFMQLQPKVLLIYSKDCHIHLNSSNPYKTVYKREKKKTNFYKYLLLTEHPKDL